MSAEIDPVIFEFKAQVSGYLTDLRTTTTKVDQLLGTQEKRVRQLEAQFERSSGQISGTLRGLAGTLAAYFTGRELVGLIDNFTRFQNSLKVAGLEGANLASVQEKLFAIAQKNGVELAAVGQLYSRTAQNQRELGASTEELIQLSEAVATSLRISGTSSTEASGALLQLGQALGSPRVQAEEFNSLLDTMQPLLRAASKYIDGTGGSLAGLTQKIKDTNGPGVSNVELFNAIIQALKDLQEQSNGTSTTLSGAFTTLSNALQKYIGEANQANGATGAIVSGIEALARNLDTIIPAIAALATAMGVGYVANATRKRLADAAIIATQMGIAGSAGTAGVAVGTLARSLLAAFGGPVGIAIAAITTGIALFAFHTNEADQATASLDASMADVSAKLANFRKNTESTAAATGKLTKEQNALINATAAMTGEVDLLAQAWARVAAQAKAAAVEEAKALMMSAKRNRDEAQMQYARQNPGDTSSFYSGSGIPVPSLANNATRRGASDRRMQGSIDSLYGTNAGRLVAGANARVTKAEADYRAAQANLDAVTKAPLATFRPAYGGGAGGGAKGGGAKAPKGGKGPAGPTAEETAAKHAEAMAQLEMQTLQARRELATDAGERADLEKEMMRLERDERIKQIEADKNYTREQKDAQIAAVQAIYGTDAKLDAQGNIVAAAKPSLGGQIINREYDRKQTELALAMIDAEQSTLAAEQDIETSTAKRREVERRMLDLQQEAEKMRLEEAIAAGDVADAVKARALLERKQAAERRSLANGQLSPGAAYVRDLGIAGQNIDDAVGRIQVQGLERLNDQLADAILNAKNLGDVFKSVANQIISDLLRIAIQQAIIKPLAEKLFGGGGSSAGGIAGVVSGFASLFGGGGGTGSKAVGSGLSALFGRASGGYIAPGQMVRVNEGAGSGKVEGFMSRDGGHIVPLGRMNVAQGGGPGGSKDVVVRLQLSDDLDARIQSQSAGVAVEVYKAALPSTLDAAANHTMNKAARVRL